jgi:hypothetical protein
VSSILCPLVSLAISKDELPPCILDAMNNFLAEHTYPAEAMVSPKELDTDLNRRAKESAQVEADGTPVLSEAWSQPFSPRRSMDRTASVPPQCTQTSATHDATFARDEDTAEKQFGQANPNTSSAASDKDLVLEVRWDGLNDSGNPKGPNFASLSKKWVIVLIGSSASMCVTSASAMYTSIYDQVEPEFHATRLQMTAGLSLFVWGLGLGPLLFSPLSEFYGRKPIYVCSLALFMIWLIPCAVAKGTATMLVSRFFNAVAGSAFLSVAGGTVGDLFPSDKLSLPMTIYTASPFVGPLVSYTTVSFMSNQELTGP